MLNDLCSCDVIVYVALVFVDTKNLERHGPSHDGNEISFDLDTRKHIHCEAVSLFPSPPLSLGLPSSEE